MDLSVILKNAPFMLGGLILSFQLAAITIIAVLILCIFLASARLSSISVCYYPATIYIHFFRGLPLILVIFWLYFLAPVILGTSVNEFTAAALAFVVFEAAYFAEIVRSGIQAVPFGQVMAAHSTGLSSLETARFVVIPQALRNMVPALVTQSVVVFQDTSLGYVIGLREFLRRVNLTDAREARSVELYLFAGLVYFSICSVGSLASQRLEKRRVEAD
jgi:glutamate/aspartate transport system permease protein